MKSSGKPIEILTKLNELAGFAPDQEIELFEVCLVTTSQYTVHICTYSITHKKMLHIVDKSVSFFYLRCVEHYFRIAMLLFAIFTGNQI